MLLRTCTKYARAVMDVSAARRGSSTAFFAMKYAILLSPIPAPTVDSLHATTLSPPNTLSDVNPMVSPRESEYMSMLTGRALTVTTPIIQH